MRITTLVENRPSPDDPELVAEWGLSQCVELAGRRVLFDMGASDAFARNARRLGIDIATIDAAVLSHHHSDHGGGLQRFLELNAQAPVYLGEPPPGEPTARLLGVVKKRIGLDRSLLERHASRFRFVRERTEVVPGLFVLPRIGGHHHRPSGNRFLYLRRDDGLAPDDFRHEVVVAIRERDALVVLTGCSHNGVVNMVERVTAEFPGLPVRALLGGFHLVSLPPFNGMSEPRATVEDIARAVLDRGVARTYTGHCTGSKAYRVLRSVMGERIHEVRTGSRIEL